MVAALNISGYRQRFSGQVKPTGVPVIDWSHPLAAGLVFYGFDIGSQVVDLARHRVSSKSGTPPGDGTTVGGSSISWNAASNINFASDAEIQALQAAPPWTVACAVVSGGVQGSNVRPFNRTANNGASQPFINAGFYGTGNLMGAVNSGGVLTNVGTAFAYSTGVFTSYCLTAPGATSAAFYAQGKQSGATVTGLTIASANTTSAVLMTGASAAGTANTWLGAVFYGGIWSRCLTDFEIMQLHLDPYCFLVSPENEMEIGYVAAAGFFSRYYYDMSRAA